MSHPESDPGPLGDDDLVPADDSVISRVFVRSLVVLVAVAVLAVGGFFLLRSAPGEVPGREIEVIAPEPVLARVEPPTVRFVDITAEAGIDFVHESGAAGERLLPETMGAGAAFFDYDDDGDQDLLLVNSDRWTTSSASGRRPTMALYENDGSGRFRDVSRECGLDVSFYGTGVAVGDYDNDGDLDLFISAMGPNHLFRNEDRGGRRRFVEAPEAGVAGGRDSWSSSSAFFDYDNDGDLDLFVGNYVRWSREIDLALDYRLDGVGRAYGPPLNYEGTLPYFYRNEGGGRFVEVSREVGIEVRNRATGEPVAKSLGVRPADVDRDGFIDLFVANDTVRNFFFHNLGDGTFAERAELYGLAYGRDGAATGAMGVDAGDIRNSNELAFAVGNFANEMTSLYAPQGEATLYGDEAIVAGLAAPSRRVLTFGVFFFDYDLDGRLDLLQVNGHLEEEIHRVEPSQSYRQSAQLFWNSGAGRTYVEIDRDRSGDLSRPIVGRGATYADIDADGDLDLLLLQTGGPPLLLRNDQELGHHWLRIQLRGAPGEHGDAIGAWVELETDGVWQRRQVMPTRSYQSQVELPLTFGLGAASRVERLLITWPNGSQQEMRDVEVDRLLVVRQAGFER